MPYLQPADLWAATTQLISTSLGTQGVDFTLYTPVQLQSLIARASAQIDGYCKQSFALTNVQERYMGRGTNHLRLRKYPLAQLTDSVFGGSGPVSQSLVADTTFTVAITAGQITAGINQVVVADISNLLIGQYVQWADGTSEPGLAITTIVPATAGATSGAGTVTLKANLTVAHPIPPVVTPLTARVVVNTLDFVMIVLPGQSVFPIPIQQLVVDAEHGGIMNYTPLMFQSLGYATIFPNMLPLLARYTYGFLANQLPATFREVVLEQCRRIVLNSGNLAGAGISSIKSGDASVGFAQWKPTLFGEDLQDMLGPFKRNVGFT